jgi:large subunit ribosomal protein L9
MPKTEVILTHNIVGLGAESDQVKVAAGYARNYLFPQRLAIPLTSANKRQIEVLRQRRAEREAHEFNSMSELARGISKLTAIIKVKTGDDGKMFGSVTSGTIADELKHQFDITLEKRKIHLEHPIKTLGDHDVELRLHGEVNTTLKVRVESINPLPQAPEPERAHGGRDRDREGGPRTEKRGRRPEGREGREARPEVKAEKPPARAEKAGKPEKAEAPAKGAKEQKPKGSKAEKSK